MQGNASLIHEESGRVGKARFVKTMEPRMTDIHLGQSVSNIRGNIVLKIPPD